MSTTTNFRFYFGELETFTNMGCIVSCQKRDDHRKHEIKAYMDEIEKQDEKIVKLVLLGAGATGKSTLFESIKASHCGGNLSDNFKQRQKRLIWMDIVDSFTILIRQCAILYAKNSALYKESQLAPDSNSQRAIDLLMKMHEKYIFSDIDDYCDDELRLLGECIESVWNLDCIQATYNHRFNKFSINDNLRHFCDNSKLKSIFSVDYAPTVQDCLLNRTKTCGMQQYEYSPTCTSTGERCFRLIDCGGVRAERRRWINYFDGFSYTL